MAKKVDVHVRTDVGKSKPQRANTKTQHTEFIAVPHNDKTSGYKGKFVPRTQASERASKKLVQQLKGAPLNPSQYING
jgi:hypothetical protein